MSFLMYCIESQLFKLSVSGSKPVNKIIKWHKASSDYFMFVPAY